jgi:hypothetical protein
MAKATAASEVAAPQTSRPWTHRAATPSTAPGATRRSSGALGALITQLAGNGTALVTAYSHSYERVRK